MLTSVTKLCIIACMELSHDIVDANEVALPQQILADTKPRPASNSANTSPSMSLLGLSALKVTGISAPDEEVVGRWELQP